MTAVQSPAAQIASGLHDADLDYAAIRARRSVLARSSTAGIQIGDKVTFAENIRPRYLIGLSATVVRINPQSITVDCPDDPEYGRFQGAKGVRCPRTLIEGAS